ncbi:MAG TPA: selenocysteine-specific translation elongation factor [Firmicutes bacterium]|jgi:selenocysteine-specific elongation factor|nr:selenocysteine-specific translation elongation factor [Bacillota bacterium]
MIIGTAGHVDHGKTELIKALTGIDTDRLKEEKERGISIDLGFAPFRLPGGRLAGVVDVPGHEKFIHNMLAGIGGIDLVIMVIDAAEGVMPQTKEHLDVLELLQIKKGLVVITKIDLVDKEWLEMVEEEVRDSLQGTFLSESPLHFVSSLTGEGIAELREDLARIAETVSARDKDAPLRIPLDRVFSIAGFGTVVTGTVLSGTVQEGQTVEVVPPGKELRVRGVQLHGENTGIAQAGQRVALNLAGLEKKEVIRGSVVASPGFFGTTRTLDVKVRLLASASRPLINMSPVHFYLGTARVVARVYLLGRDELAPGEEGFAQCRLDKPLVAQRGDRFIIRSYSPMITVGGGIVLDERPQRHKRFKAAVLEKLQDLEKEDPLPFVLQKLKAAQGGTLGELNQLLKMGTNRLKEILDRAIKEKKVVLAGDYYVDADTREEWAAAIINKLEGFHQEKPLLPGMQKAHLRGALPRKVTGRIYDALLKYLKDKGLIETNGELVCRKGFSPMPTPAQQKKLEKMLEIFQKEGLNPPPLKELWVLTGIKKEEGEDLLDCLVYENLLVKINEEVYLHSETYSRCLEILKNYLQDNSSITLARYRDLIGSSRKYAQALLEHFDSCNYTRRIGDERVPWKLLNR